MYYVHHFSIVNFQQTTVLTFPSKGASTFRAIVFFFFFFFFFFCWFFFFFFFHWSRGTHSISYSLACAQNSDENVHTRRRIRVVVVRLDAHPAAPPRPAYMPETWAQMFKTNDVVK